MTYAIPYIRIVPLVLLVAGASLFGCATPQTMSPAPTAPLVESDSNIPIDPETAKSLQEQWSAYKRVHLAATNTNPSPWAFSQNDLKLAQDAAIFTERDPMRFVYESRFLLPVFFQQGKLTEEGRKAHTLVSEAWTHAIQRPENWPDGIDTMTTRNQELHATIEAEFKRPLSDSDIRRIMLADPSKKGAVLDVKQLSAQTLDALDKLDTLRSQLRTHTARFDGAILSAIWQMARATREPLLRSRWNSSQKLDFPRELYTTPEAALHTVVPHHEDYEALRQSYIHYYELAQSNAFGKPLPIYLREGIQRVGFKNKYLPLLRERLAAEGFVPKNEPKNPIVYDEELKEIVHLFQYTRGLKRTGFLSPGTWKALNVPAETLLKRLELGLIRWHHSKSRGAERYIRVNVARYQIQLMRGNTVEERIRAVVGRPGKATPRFIGNISHMVAYPWWWGIGDDPQRVPPGKRNPLGLLALKMEPHGYLIYLHGTSQPKLLDNVYRSYSAGCIRMKDPTKLAGIILDEDSNPETSEDLKRIMARKKTHTIWLKDRSPVYIEYNTTFVHEETKRIHFNTDIYATDHKKLAQLRGRQLAFNTWPEATQDTPRKTQSAELTAP